MDVIEDYMCSLYGLRTMQSYDIGQNIKLYILAGNTHMGNTAIDMIDLQSLNDYLTKIGQQENLDVHWSIVKTASCTKENILISLGKKVSGKSSPNNILLTNPRKSRQPIQTTSTMESLVQESLGIENTTNLGRWIIYGLDFILFFSFGKCFVVVHFIF